jgi:UDP-N-acetylglucosamine diphosphorylase/glucosamine-1-phosphate N-acetyltransferase
VAVFFAPFFLNTFQPAMKKIVFTEEYCQPERLFPFTLTRAVQDIRVGILTIREKWEQFLGMPSFDKLEDPQKANERSVLIEEAIGDDQFLLIHGNVVPSQKIIKQVKKLKPGEFLSSPERESFVYCLSKKQVVDLNKIKVKKAVETDWNIKEINFAWDIFQLNAWAIQNDFELLTAKRKSQKISSTNKVQGSAIFLEKGVNMEHCILNAEEGPIYIDKDAVIMEGSLLRGPLSIGRNATVKMGTRIYGATTIGSNCIVGGEIKNSVFFGNSNKAHDGYLGDSVIGEWCNMGAGTSNSNLKNNASMVSLWTPIGLQSVGLKCGVMMGDYSRTAINTSINTGTVVGVCCNVFGQGLTPKYIPNFSWGSDGVERYQFDKACTDINNWKALKHQQLTDQEQRLIHHLYNHV